MGWCGEAMNRVEAAARIYVYQVFPDIFMCCEGARPRVTAFKEDLMLPASMSRQSDLSAAGRYTTMRALCAFHRLMTAALTATPAHRPMKKDPMK
jgi:hypothetical protein